MRSGGGILVVNRSSDLFIGRGRRTHSYRCTQTFSRWLTQRGVKSTIVSLTAIFAQRLLHPFLGRG
jgi:N-dimethylarginine dimethylaminohydrolase